MTIKKTLDIINGNLTPSTQQLDADLIEVSKTSGNTLQVLEDGLFVSSSTGGSASVPTILLDSTLTNEVSRVDVDVVTIRYKLPVTESDPNPDVYFTNAPFLSAFRKIDTILVDNNALARGPDGGSLLQISPQVSSCKTDGTTYLINKQGLYLQKFVRDLSADLPEVGTKILTLYCSYFDNSLYNVYVNDELVYPNFQGGAGATVAFLPNNLEAGQVVKVTGSYPINGEVVVGETLTFTVGESTPPVLTLVRPPLNQFENETSFSMVTVTGVLK
jgi:hypothetical protein